MNKSYYVALIGKLATAGQIDYDKDDRFNSSDRELIREGLRELKFYGDEQWREPAAKFEGIQEQRELQSGPVKAVGRPRKSV